MSFLINKKIYIYERHFGHVYTFKGHISVIIIAKPLNLNHAELSHLFLLCPQTLFNPNKTVVKMFLVTYNFNDMPVNHMTFLRHRIFLVPVEEGAEGKGEASPGSGMLDRKKILCYLIHLRYN